LGFLNSGRANNAENKAPNLFGGSNFMSNGAGISTSLLDQNRRFVNGDRGATNQSTKESHNVAGSNSCFYGQQSQQEFQAPCLTPISVIGNGAFGKLAHPALFTNFLLFLEF